MGEREFIVYIALLTAMSALAIDMLLPAFEDIRPAFGLPEDSTRLALTVTLFLVGSGIGPIFYGPITDAIGRKRTLAFALSLYALAALAAALAPSLGILYASRFIWGFASSGPRIVAQAIVRDRFAGTAMARVMTLVQSLFSIGPVIAPLLGKGILEVSSWRWVLAFGIVQGLVAMLWLTRLSETLPAERRRPLKFGAALSGIGFVARNRVCLGYSLSVTFGFAAFLTFLGSTELVFSDIYGNAGWFVPYFSAKGVLSASVALTINQLLRYFAARQMALATGIGFVVVSAALFAVTVNGDGKPSFAVWLVLFTLANTCHVATFPTATSLAMEPMGALAGTAAALVGFSGGVAGALLASFTDRAIDGNVMPIGIAYLIYSSLALACQLWARQSKPAF